MQGRRQTIKRHGSVGLRVLTRHVHHSNHLCIKVFLLIRIFLDLRNTGVPNGLSLFTLASAAKRSHRKRKRQEVILLLNAQKVQTTFNKNVRARTIKGQE
jgi:hypothetical protein